MRKTSSSIDALLPKVRQLILSATLLHEDRWWYLSDLAKHLGLTPSSLQRELKSLTEAGILQRRKEGNRVYYQAEKNCPFYPELRGLLLKTAGLLDVLREALEELDGVELAFVYGSIARGQETPQSDVDIALIGDCTFTEVVSALETAQRRLGREVNPTVFPPAEFRKKARRRNHFILSLLDGEKLFVVGSLRELERLVT